MRLWHKDLISVLPRQQLLSQWRECCCIAKNMKTNGTPNHLLVNKILDYDEYHFIYYSILIRQEMLRRGYKCDFTKFSKYYDFVFDDYYMPLEDDLFDNWHNYRYFVQCYCNLQEKYDCGGIDDEEWGKIDEHKKIMSTIIFAKEYSKLAEEFIK